MTQPIHSTATASALMLRRFRDVRAATMTLVAPLSEADCQVQSMPDASPTRWHLAHVTWFFETFVLERFEPGFKPYHPAFRVLFNSYYRGVGEQHPRAQRGLVTRPGLAEVMAYRAAVDERVATVMARHPDDAALHQLVELGLQHEQQHQELILTDLKHLLSLNPLAPAYHRTWPLAPVSPVALDFVGFAGGLAEIGHRSSGFGFDNEAPRHKVWLRPFGLANRLVTHGDWANFMADGGYTDSRWWLSAGWDWVRTQDAVAPMYWRGSEVEGWRSFTLHGEVPIDPHTPVAHISLFEADAYARWRGTQDSRPMRLPTEAEWEHAAQIHEVAAMAHANFVDSGALHPMPVARMLPSGTPMQLFGDVWEWTVSAYLPYPGYRPWAGAVGEYNGKFMVDQTVLRGGSCATPRSHMRASYRNFFPTDARWQFSGLRLAQDLD